MKYRLQDTIAQIAFAAQTASLAREQDEHMPMVFTILLCQHESTKKVLHNAGLSGEMLSKLYDNAILDLDDIKDGQ